MNEFMFYLAVLLGTFSTTCALWLAMELKKTEKELEEARELLNQKKTELTEENA